MKDDTANNERAVRLEANKSVHASSDSVRDAGDRDGFSVFEYHILFNNKPWSEYAAKPYVDRHNE